MFSQMVAGRDRSAPVVHMVTTASSSGTKEIKQTICHPWLFRRPPDRNDPTTIEPNTAKSFMLWTRVRSSGRQQSRTIADAPAKPRFQPTPSRTSDAQKCQTVEPETADTGDGHQPTTDLRLARPGDDLPVVLQDLCLYQAELGRQHLEAGPGLRGNASIVRVGDHIQQALHPLAPDRRDDTELGQVRTDGVGHLRALARQNATDPVQHHGALLFRAFHGHEAHGGPRHGFADRLRVRRVVLASLHIRLT
jgi:hypothetical protein